MKLVVVLIASLLISALLGIGLTSLLINRQAVSKIANSGVWLKQLNYVESPGNQKPVGLSGPFDDHYGSTYITIIGQMQTVEKRGERYFLNILTMYNNKAYLLNVDLSTKDHVLGWLDSVDKQTNVPTYRAVSTDQVYSKLIKTEKKVFRVDLMTKLNPETFNNPKCLQACKLVYSEFAKYSTANKWLEQKISNMSQSDLSEKTYGAVSLVYESL